ncbi:hypothetical protein L7F22_062175 [Adiantum nelumboides]|nr:hypothetical protein [Adiantum nelumboides]
MTTLCTVLGLVAIQDMELVQMDVKTAFLHGDLDETVYMKQLEHFVNEPTKPTKAELVCKLRKVLYGLKQGSRQWYQKFDKFMQSQGYTRSQEDQCLNTRKANNGSLIILILYVDDMLIARKSIDEVNQLKKVLGTQFVASNASKEAIWLARLVGDLGIYQVPVLHCDSRSARALANNHVFHSKSKHIEVRYHVIRDVLAGKRIELVKVHTDDNTADALTKSLALERFAHCIERMGVG